MNEYELFDTRGFGQSSGASSAALSKRLSILVHHLLIIPTHAQHNVGITRQFP